MVEAEKRPRKKRPSLDPKLLPVVEGRLANGLELRIVPNAAVPAVSYYTFFKVGSRNEQPGKTGLAHLFEHMMFNGTAKHGPREFDRILESAGGSSNAYTSTDFTVYHDDFAKEALETVVELESDRMQSLLLSPEMLESEREVVKEERRYRVDNDVIGLLDEALHALVFRAHPYRWPVIGWMGDLDAITREDAEDFYRRHYAPNNALLVVAGDVDPEKTLRLLERAYGDIPPGPPVAPVIDSEPAPNGERRAEVRYPSHAPALMVGFRAGRAAAPETPALDLIQAILGLGEASRLTRRLVYEEELATHIDVDASWRVDPGVFLIFAELPPGARPEKVEARLYEELETLATTGVRQEELRRAKNLLRAHFLHEIATCGGRAHAVGHHELLLGDWREMFGVLERYEAVQPAEIRRVAEAIFRAENRSVATLVPEAPAPRRRGR